MGRKPSDPDYGLPPLTFEEAAALFQVDVGAFMIWVMETVKPSPSRWSEWTEKRRPLPERLIRLYLMTRAARAGPPTTKPPERLTMERPKARGADARARGGHAQ